MHVAVAYGVEILHRLLVQLITTFDGKSMQFRVQEGGLSSLLTDTLFHMIQYIM